MRYVICERHLILFLVQSAWTDPTPCWQASIGWDTCPALLTMTSSKDAVLSCMTINFLLFLNFKFGNITIWSYWFGYVMRNLNYFKVQFHNPRQSRISINSIFCMAFLIKINFYIWLSMYIKIKTITKKNVNVNATTLGTRCYQSHKTNRNQVQMM